LTTLFISLLCLTIIISKKLYKSYINPLSLFLGNFFLALAIFYSVDFIDQDLSNKAIAIIVISLLAFIYGTIMANLLYRIHNKKTKINNNELKKNYEIKIEDIKIFRIIFIISLVGFFYFLYTVETHIGILTVLKDPNLLNLAYFYSEINFSRLPMYMMKTSMVNSMFLLLYIIKFRCKNISIYAMFIIEILINISVKRNILVYIVMLNFFIFVYYTGHEFQNIIKNKTGGMKNAKKYIILICVIILAGYYFSRTQSLLNKQFTTQGALFGIKLPEFMITIITYYTANFESFNIYLSTNLSDVPIFGSTLRFLYLFLAKLHLVRYDDSFLSLPFVSVPEMFNTTIGQYYIYIEADIVGVILFYFFIGIVSTALYYKYQKSRDDIILMYLAVVSMLLLFNIREYVVITIDFWITLLVIIIIQLRCGITRRKSC
jgi:oligosaccharide repeat unit polymerase